MSDYCRKCKDRMVLTCEDCDSKYYRNQTLDLFLAECEKEAWAEPGMIDDDDKLLLFSSVRKIAKRMRGV